MYGGLEPHQFNGSVFMTQQVNHGDGNQYYTTRKSSTGHWHPEAIAPMTMCKLNKFPYAKSPRDTCNIVSCSAGVRGVLRA